MEEEKKLEEKLKEVGSKLETLPCTKDGVIKLLKVTPFFEFEQKSTLCLVAEKNLERE
jgi:hypothetical protein